MEPRDPRPGFEQPARAWVRLPRSEIVFGLVLGLLMSAVLIGVMPDVRHHMFGGTDLRETTVVEAASRTRPGDSDREVAHYRLVWRDEDGAEHVSTFKRSGPVRHAVGETWDLWVSPERDEATDEAPWVVWLWLGVGIPLFSVLMGWLWQWRQRVLARSVLRGVEAGEQRRARKAARRAD